MRTKTNFLQAKKKRAANFLHVTWQAKFLGNLLLNVYVRFIAVHIPGAALLDCDRAENRAFS